MTARDLGTGFGGVDSSGAVAELVAYLRYVNDLPAARASKARILDALELEPGMHVLDADSGVGFDACRFAERVGPEGRALGIDASRATVSWAERLRPAGLSQLSFEIGDAAALDLPDGIFR
ncbi:MAG: methyltransferase domain-containing protein [Methanospirillum sp.]